METKREQGIGLCGLFFIVLFILKVCGVGVVADWSWWWITAPLWGPIAIVLVIVFVCFIVGALVE